MPTAAATLLLLALVVFSLVGSRPESTVSSGPQYAASDQLVFPEHYRDWPFLTAGFDMSYRADMQMGDHHMFDNVFVNPQAYRAFVKTGTWPDGTMLVLEVREAHGKGSINLRGNFQTDVMGVEVHVKDTAHFAAGWAFFAFDPGGKTSPMIPRAASCYACHSAHAAVDTTFVQFYPTLLSIAKSKDTLSSVYRNEQTASTK